jgi:hypothetical protein
VEQMTVEDFRSTADNKIHGTWNLHKQFDKPGDLDFFIMYSSISGILGIASQAAYGAAGTYEDALAHWRVKTCGLPAVSIDFGTINNVGYVAETDGTLQRMRRTGFRGLNEDEVLGAIETAILAPYDPQFILGFNTGPGHHWDTDGEGQVGRDMRCLSVKYHTATHNRNSQRRTAGGGGGAELGTRLAECDSRDEAVRLVAAALTIKLAEILMIPTEEIDMAKPPSQQGVDSLVAVEVRNMLVRQAAAEVSIFGIMQSQSLAALVTEVADKSAHIALPIS